MASFNFLITFSFLVPFHLLLSSSASQPHHHQSLQIPNFFTPKSPLSPETICNSTPFPSLCISILPNRTSNVYDFGRASIHHSISQSRKLLDSVDRYLRRTSVSNLPTLRALQDCRHLVSLNLDFLKTCSDTISAANKTLAVSEADGALTKLSAVITNLQTCRESLESSANSSVNNYLSDSLSKDSKSHSVSLALFVIPGGWVPRHRGREIALQPRTRHPTSGDRRLPPMQMSSRNRRIFEAAARHSPRGRQLAEAAEGAANNGSAAVVVKDIVVVSKDGSGNFTTIGAAVDAAPGNSNPSDGYFLIYVTAGEYEEYVSIPKNKSYVLMVGDGVDQTNITGSRSVGDGWTTFNSATFAVEAEGFVAVGITFQNRAGPSKGQAVAVRNGADLSAFYLCSFEAYQDTLYAHSQRQFYRECDIYGTVDFIFGNSAVVFQNCNLLPRSRPQRYSNYITAQGRTDANQNTGTSIHNCTIAAAEHLNATMSYLGRPWKNYSTTVYLQSFMGDIIDPAGWKQWDANLSTIFYAEYNNTGPGSNTSLRVTWPGYHVLTSASDAANFTVSNFLLGDTWLPQTGVPYTGALMSSL